MSGPVNFMMIAEALDEDTGERLHGMRWRPIKYAPRNGSFFIGFHPKGFGDGRGNFSGVVRFLHGRWEWCFPKDDTMAAPTFWMPLPPAPPLVGE